MTPATCAGFGADGAAHCSDTSIGSKTTFPRVHAEPTGLGIRKGEHVESRSNRLMQVLRPTCTWPSRVIPRSGTGASMAGRKFQPGHVLLDFGAVWMNESILSSEDCGREARSVYKYMPTSDRRACLGGLHFSSRGHSYKYVTITKVSDPRRRSTNVGSG